MEVGEIRRARRTAVKDRAIKLRYVTEITLDNLEYCKEMLTFSEIRHLDKMKGNFEVADEKEYVAVATLNPERPIPQLIFSNVPEIVEQQQFVFDSFWSKAIPAEQKIKELEKGIVSSVTGILTDYKEAEKKEWDMIRKANKEIQIIYSTASAFHLQEKSGVLELLKEKADGQENLDINILVPVNSSIKKSLSIKLLTKTINNNIHILDIEPTINIKIKSLVVDQKESLVMEIKELRDQKMDPAIGFSIYSNSLPTVLTYSSIFEMISNQSILALELKNEGEIKDEFINTAAHELRTPTQAITGYVEMNKEMFDELLKNTDDITTEQRNILVHLQSQHETISRNALRLNDLINNLLDVARLESNPNSEITLYKEDIDLVKEITNIIDVQFSQKIRDKGINVNFMYDSIVENDNMVFADKSRLQQILNNLIDNAIKFSKRDSDIHIMIKDTNDIELKTTSNELEKEAVAESADAELNHTDTNKLSNYIDQRKSRITEKNNPRKTKREEFVYVSVSDSGKGISSKIMPKLFEKFVTDSDFGTGLGLFITKKLVENHGGRIWAFNNQDGIGSTFIFSLPK